MLGPGCGGNAIGLRAAPLAPAIAPAAPAPHPEHSHARAVMQRSAEHWRKEEFTFYTTFFGPEQHIGAIEENFITFPSLARVSQVRWQIAACESTKHVLPMTLAAYSLLI